MRALLLALVLSSTAALAQPTLSLSGTVGIPQAGFRDAMPHVGGGLSVGLLYQVPRTPLAVGVEGAVLIHGWEHRREPLSTTIPDVAVDVNTSNNLAQGLGVLRLQVPGGPLRPYVDGLAGVTYLFTQTQVEDHYDDPVFSSVNYDDAAFVYGAGVGTQVRLHTAVTDDGRPYDVLLDARVRYLRGGEASYLGAGDIERFRDGTYTVSPRTSTTDLLLPQLGVTFRW